MLTRADLNLPPGFNGQGMHYDPEGCKSQDEYEHDPLYRGQVDSDFELMAQLGITCVTVLDAQPFIYTLANRYGMVIVNRPMHRAYEPMPDRDSVGIARRAGHPGITQIDNEFVLPVEWDGKDINWYVSRQHLIDASIKVYDAGGIVAWNPMDFAYFRFCVDGIWEQGAEKIFQRFLLILHNYGINHPPTYKKDDGGYLQFIFWAEVCKQKLGFIPFMIGGEWGWGLGESADIYFPVVTAELRNQYEQECYEAFRTGQLSDGYEIPDYYLASNKWILNARFRTYWGDDAIIKDNGLRREDFIASMLERPHFTRRFTDTMPDPTPVQPPLPTLASEYPEAYNAWTQAGGDPEEAFRFYLQGTGRIAVTAEDLAKAILRAQAHVGEIAEMGKRLPFPPAGQ